MEITIYSIVLIICFLAGLTYMQNKYEEFKEPTAYMLQKQKDETDDEFFKRNMNDDKILKKARHIQSDIDDIRRDVFGYFFLFAVLIFLTITSNGIDRVIKSFTENTLFGLVLRILPLIIYVAGITIAYRIKECDYKERFQTLFDLNERNLTEAYSKKMSAAVILVFFGTCLIFIGFLF